MQPDLRTFITDSPERAAAICREGFPVAFPTETVYGLGARLSDEAAIARIYAAKGRPPSNPLIAHVLDVEKVSCLAHDVPPFAHTLFGAFSPGPITLVLRRRPDVPPHAFAGLSTIGIRIPSHPAARQFIEEVGETVVAPSANRSGRPSPTRWQDVLEDLEGRCACILRGDPSEMGLESTVIDCTGRAPLVLRPGSITLEMLRDVVPSAASTSAADLLVRSPGTRFRHYAPRAEVVLIDRPPAIPPPESAFIGLTAPAHAEAWTLVLSCENVAEYARSLFGFLREADARGAEHIYCERVDKTGLGVAIMDRLERAAAG